MKVIILTLLTALSLHANTYYPTKFKKIIHQNASFNPQLKEILFQILSKPHQTSPNEDDQLIDSCNMEDRDDCFKHTVLSHTMMKKHLFGDIHLQEDNKGYYIEDYYCQKKFRAKEGVAPMTEPYNHKVNTEHSWPRSKFSGNFSQRLQTDDLHHLFPTDSRANSSRSNLPFGNVIAGKYVQNCPTEPMIGYADSNEQHRKFFDPPSEVKGDIARAMFYFAIRYKIQIHEPQETFFRLWHYEDPVSAWEENRNDRIFELQFNRNPFIDHPHLVEKILDF